MKTNEELLAEANSIEFKFMKNGKVNHFQHTKYELGLYTIKRAIESHGIDTYLYGKLNYISIKTKVTVVCPLHGDFEISPDNLIKGRGCPQCYSEGRVVDTASFIAKAQDIHGGEYDYSKVAYLRNNSKVEIICKEHGPFYQTPGNHLNWQRCPICAGNKTPHTNEQFITKAKEVHGDKYDYSQVLYQNSWKKVCIICSVHGPFYQVPQNHLNGSGCQKCAGRNHDILYLLKCTNTGWYKVGITTGGIKRRILQIGGSLEEVYYVKTEDPMKHEKYIHQAYKKDRKLNLCVDQGNTEFFSLTEEQVKEVINYMKEL